MTSKVQKDDDDDAAPAMMHPDSPGTLNNPTNPKSISPIVNRLYVSEVYSRFVLTESESILHVPAARRRYPNDPAVYVARRFGWYRVAMMRALFTAPTDADGNANFIASVEAATGLANWTS